MRQRIKDIIDKIKRAKERWEVRFLGTLILADVGLISFGIALGAIKGSITVGYTVGCLVASFYNIRGIVMWDYKKNEWKEFELSKLWTKKSKR